MSKRLLKYFATTLLGLNLILFALVPLLNVGQIAPKTWSSELLGVYVNLHKGAGNWSFYTTKNGMLNVEVFRENTQTGEVTKIASPRPRISPAWLIYRGHSDIRFLTIGVSVVDRYPEKYQWLCENYDFQKGPRYHVTVAPFALKETIEFLPKIPESYKGMAFNVVQAAKLPFKAISFICN